MSIQKTLGIALAVTGVIVFASVRGAHIGRQIKEQEMHPIINKGGGVYYFRCTGETFSQKLAEFLIVHPELEVVQSIPAQEDYVGVFSSGSQIVGYTVITKKPEP